MIFFASHYILILSSNIFSSFFYLSLILAYKCIFLPSLFSTSTIFSSPMCLMFFHIQCFFNTQVLLISALHRNKFTSVLKQQRALKDRFEKKSQIFCHIFFVTRFRFHTRKRSKKYYFSCVELDAWRKDHKKNLQEEK